jgi:hypothetical protein
MLCLHRGAVPVTRAELAAVPTPPGAGRWKPIAHAELVDSILERAAICGLEVAEERFGLQAEGNRLYGALRFQPHPNLALPEGMAPCLGLRNSHDKTAAVQIIVGANVFVCDNGVFQGDFKLRRKHTSGFSLDHGVDEVFQRFSDGIGALNLMVNELKNRLLRPKDASHLILTAFRKKAMPWKYLPEVVREYHTPRHEEFQPRNAWSLYNSVSEIVKRRSPRDQIRTFRVLNAVLCGTTASAAN